MAFTLEEIEAAFRIRPKGLHFDLDPEERKKNINHDEIMGYLTGKHHSLQGLQKSPAALCWYPLVHLLTNIESPSANEQLVIDLAMLPNIDSYLHHHFLGWLLDHIISRPTEEVWQAALKLYHALNYSNDRVMKTFTLIYGRYAFPQDFWQQSTPLKKFLLEEIRNSPADAISKDDTYRTWSEAYLYLAEEVRPDLAKAYAVCVSTVTQSQSLTFFAAYKDGYYMPDILEILKGPAFRFSHYWRLNAFIKLMEFDEQAYTAITIEVANNLLEKFIESPSGQWESCLEIAEFKKNPPADLPCSVIAFHYLLKFDRETGNYWLQEFQKKKIRFNKALPRIVYLHLQKEALPFLQHGFAEEGDADFLKAVINILVKEFDTASILPILWNGVFLKSKPVKELLANVLFQKDSDAEAKAIALLDHKKTDVRLTAAMVLSYFVHSPITREALRKVLNKEANEATRDIFLEIVAQSFPATPDHAFIQSVVDAARERGKLNKPIEDFLDEEKMPALYYKDGKAVTAEEVRFLLYRMKRVKAMRSEPEAKLVISQLDKEKSGDFALYIIKRFIDSGGKPEHKYLLAIVALIGNDEVADKIRISLNSWIEENRLKMAEHAVGALALIGTNKTLRWVEWYSRKYRNKKSVVGVAALAALEAAAQELNISTYELGDRIVPDFGFEGLFKNFTAGGESYRAFIDSNFKIAFFNDDNKKLKALPAATDEELKEEFKSIAKEVRDVVKSQSSRLEYYMVIQRRWTIAQWQQFFLSNPIMFIYATKLLWGVYDNNRLTQCFYCQEDTTLADAEDNEIELAEDAQIGIVHPLQLSAGALQTWNQKFFDLGAEPVFPQLNRPVYHLPAEDQQLTIIRKYEGVKTAQGAIKSTLDKQGWTKGAAEDGGYINLFSKDDHISGIKAMLEVEGVYAAGFDNDHEPKLGRLYFLSNDYEKYSAQEKTRWVGLPHDDNDPRLVPLNKVPAVFYSEVIAGISAIKLEEEKTVE